MNHGQAGGSAIGRDEVLQAAQTLREYKNGKSALERRIVANEQWWKLRHWQQMNLHDPRETVEPVSAWLFNTILNKHADAMDNRPEPVVLPREEGDRGAAETLSQVLPVILEQGGMEQLYSDMWWYKLKAGTGAAGVFWDPDAAGGLGDVALGRIDCCSCSGSRASGGCRTVGMCFTPCWRTGRSCRRGIPSWS